MLAICTIGFSSTVPAFAHDPSDEYRAGYERGYHHGYQHGYYDAVSGLGYENVAESHGAEVYGPYGEGMHEGEHAGAMMSAFALDLATTITIIPGSSEISFGDDDDER
jgi:hypothetical protein